MSTSHHRVIAHRGACGYLPEHTLAAYELAIRQGADFVEPDVVVSRDGALVVRHENELSGTTDVADRRRFAGRRTTKTVDGVATAGWFAEDFTSDELRTLRCRERLPGTRPGSAAFDGRYPVVTLDEVLALVRRFRSRRGGPVGVVVEIKHSTYFRRLGLPLEERLMATLQAHGWAHASAPVVVQSFETANLRLLARLTEVPLAQLVERTGAPYDLASSGDPTTYADLVTPAGLAAIARYAGQVAVPKGVVIPRDPVGRLLSPTRFLADAHDAGLVVSAWTFRRENRYLPAQHRSGPDPDAAGDLPGEVARFLAAGLDRCITDHPDVAARALAARPVGAVAVG